MKLGLQAKFAVLIGLMLSFIFSIVTFSVIRSNTITLRKNLVQQSMAFSELASTPIGNAYLLYKDSGYIKILQQVERFTDLDPNIKNVYLVNIKGEVLFAQHDEGVKNIAIGDSIFETTVISQEKDGSLRIVAPFVENFGLRRFAVVYDVSSKAINRNIVEVTLLILALGVTGLLFTTILMYVLVNQFFIRPIRKVGMAAASVNAGNLDYSISLDRNDEIGELSESVGGMASRLKEDIKKLKQLDELKSEFMMIASHNLRTPLSIMQGYIEMLNDMSLVKEVKKIVEVIRVSTNRLNGFAEDILTISTIEAGNQVVTKEKSDVVELIKSMTSDYQSLLNEKQIDFRIDLPKEPVLVEYNRAQLSSAIWNLLDNSYKFTAQGGKIAIRLIVRDKKVEIEVSDTGIGIADSEKPKIFTKFHRGTSTLEYQYEGTGIGLYITKIIIEEHGGTVSFDSKLAKGSTFTISLPLAR